MDAARAPIALVEPARARLLDVADEVLGRLSPDEVPASLRAVARFVPAKRRRLGASALTGVLESDAGFRARVAEAAEQAAPELAAAVRAATTDPTATAATDPLDLSVLAYLLRPEGWEEVLTTAAGRWRAETAADDGSGAELDRLRTEVAELRAASKGEPARLREAVAAAVAAAVTDVADELASLRRTVRDRTRELRAAERERDTARATAEEAVAAARDELAAARAELAADRERMQSRVDQAGQAAEAARRGSRTERDLDDARLWLLVDTVVQAASGLRRELSLAPPSLAPADTVAGGTGRSPARTVADPAALDGVLQLPHVHLVVDGYNVTKSGYPELALADQRARLAAALAALAGRTGAEVTVVWDGAARPVVQPPAPRGVRVLFSAEDEIADDLIRRLVAAEPPGRPVVVVTSDRQVVRDTARDGVWSVPSAVLLQRLS